jgi:hypothetical protein
MISARRHIAAAMWLEAATLAVASGIHLASGERGAGVPEALIGVVLAAGAICDLRGRGGAFGAVLFAIAGFTVGITFTARGGAAADLAYHAVMLPVLAATAIALRRRTAATRPTAP